MSWGEIGKLALYAAPVVGGVLAQCKRIGVNPLLPAVGLLIGLVLEIRR